MQLVEDDDDGEPEEPPTAALVVTFAASVEVSAVSPGSCSADCGLVDAGALIDDVALAPTPDDIEPPTAPPPPAPTEDGRVCVGTLSGSVATPVLAVPLVWA